MLKINKLAVPKMSSDKRYSFDVNGRENQELVMSNLIKRLDSYQYKRCDYVNSTSSPREILLL